MKISAALITHNAAAGIARCLASLEFVDEIVVLDQNSQDGTTEICARHGAQVHQGKWEGFGPTKAAAVKLTSHRWVLSIDADEQISPELRQAILDLGEQPDRAAYAMNRLSRFLGRWIRHCGWHPDYVVRLFDKERAGFDDRAVHESIQVTGPTGRLDGLLLHFPYDDMSQYLGKLNRYSTIAAEEAFGAGKRSSLPGAILRGKLTFLRMYFLQLGILDGWHGLLLCLCSGFYVMSKYVKICRLDRA